MAEYIIDVPYKLERVDANEVDTEIKLVGFPVREEIIRCRYCKHHAWVKGVDGKAFCHLSQMLTDDKFFCAWAERSE